MTSIYESTDAYWWDEKFVSLSTTRIGISSQIHRLRQTILYGTKGKVSYNNVSQFHLPGTRNIQRRSQEFYLWRLFLLLLIVFQMSYHVLADIVSSVRSLEHTLLVALNPNICQWSQFPRTWNYLNPVLRILISDWVGWLLEVGSLK